ncbi:hypothetical protein [Roseovarius sp. D22-M7]
MAFGCLPARARRTAGTECDVADEIEGIKIAVDLSADQLEV